LLIVALRDRTLLEAYALQARRFAEARGRSLRDLELAIEPEQLDVARRNRSHHR
jgi:hypothetical protein